MPSEFGVALGAGNVSVAGIVVAGGKVDASVGTVLGGGAGVGVLEQPITQTIKTKKNRV